VGQLLTAASTLMCPHGGMVVASPASPSVTAGGVPIVVATDTFVVAGCTFSPGAPHPCTTVEWASTDTGSRAGGAATLSTDSVGLCKAGDGAVQGPVIIQATQPQASGR
jgi:hypothetical protein